MGVRKVLPKCLKKEKNMDYTNLFFLRCIYLYIYIYNDSPVTKPKSQTAAGCIWMKLCEREAGGKREERQKDLGKFRAS